MSVTVEIRGLTMRYGRLTALQDLSLSIAPGSVLGLVGPNGAGKTTTFRILATLLKPTAGEAWVAGHSVLRDQREVRRLVGYMPDFFGVYTDMKVGEYLDFFAACYGIQQPARKRLVDDLLELVDLPHRRDDYVDALSRGLKQRLCLARALVHDPQFLILDEPASGLDPRARVEIRELLRELHAMGKTILISSHILSEIEEVCTHIGIIEAGQLVTTGPLDEIRRSIAPFQVVHVGLLDRFQEAQEWLQARAEITRVAPRNDHAIEFDFAGDDPALARLLADMTAAGFAVIHFQREQTNLEDAFMRLTRGIVQ